MREDVERAVEESERTGKPESRRTPTPSLPLPLSPFAEPPLESIPLTGIRGLIAERMVASHSQTAPVTLTCRGGRVRPGRAAPAVGRRWGAGSLQRSVPLCPGQRAARASPAQRIAGWGDDPALAADRHRGGGGHGSRPAGAGGARGGAAKGWRSWLPRPPRWPNARAPASARRTSCPAAPSR